MIKVSETNLLKPIDKELVKLADEYGYKGISICVLDPDVKASVFWSKQSVKYAVGEPDLKTKMKGTDKKGGDGWPGIWRIIEKLGGGAGCGNSNQKQLVHGHPYSEVSYQKIKGVWYVKDVKNILRETSEKYGI